MAGYPSTEDRTIAELARIADAMERLLALQERLFPEPPPEPPAAVEGE